MGTTWIAIYAAAVSTMTLGWQVWSWRRARRVRLHVGFTWVDGAPRWALTVINGTDHPIRTALVGLRGTVVSRPQASSAIVDAHDSRTFYLPREHHPSPSTGSRVRAFAHLSTGEVLSAKGGGNRLGRVPVFDVHETHTRLAREIKSKGRK
jgi:hypothetical protein